MKYWFKNVADNIYIYPKSAPRNLILQTRTSDCNSAISKKLKVKNKSLYLGYKKSEGLVTMIKTPNNTFPFYWYEGKRDGKFMMAPFPRRNNVGVDE